MLDKNIKVVRRVPAFTLVELLVVISIIALLLAILMPSLQKARQQAKTIVCRSNLHQMGVIYQMYAMDYDDSLVPATTQIQPKIITWAETIADYIKINANKHSQGGGTVAAKANIFRCPSNKNRAKNESAYSYAVGVALCGDMTTNPSNPLLPMKISQLKRRTSDIVLMWDGGYEYGPAWASPAGTGNLSCYNWHNRTKSGGGGIPLPTKANGSANFLMVDGSVRHYKDPWFDTPMEDRFGFRWAGVNSATVTHDIWFGFSDR